MKNIIKLLALLPLFATMACDDLFEPAIENNRDLDAMYSDADYALGVLGNGYTLRQPAMWQQMMPYQMTTAIPGVRWQPEPGRHRTTPLPNGRTATMPFSI